MKLPLVSGRETTGGGSFCPNVEDEIATKNKFFCYGWQWEIDYRWVKT